MFVLTTLLLLMLLLQLLLVVVVVHSALLSLKPVMQPRLPALLPCQRFSVTLACLSAATGPLLVPMLRRATVTATAAACTRVGCSRAIAGDSCFRRGRRYIPADRCPF